MMELVMTLADTVKFHAERDWDLQTVAKAYAIIADFQSELIGCYGSKYIDEAPVAELWYDNYKDKWDHVQAQGNQPCDWKLEKFCNGKRVVCARMNDYSASVIRWKLMSCDEYAKAACVDRLKETKNGYVLDSKSKILFRQTNVGRIFEYSLVFHKGDEVCDFIYRATEIN